MLHSENCNEMSNVSRKSLNADDEDNVYAIADDNCRSEEDIYNY